MHKPRGLQICNFQPPPPPFFVSLQNFNFLYGERFLAPLPLLMNHKIECFHVWAVFFYLDSFTIYCMRSVWLIVLQTTGKNCPTYHLDLIAFEKTFWQQKCSSRIEWRYVTSEWGIEFHRNFNLTKSACTACCPGPNFGI